MSRTYSLVMIKRSMRLSSRKGRLLQTLYQVVKTELSYKQNSQFTGQYVVQPS